MDEDNYRSTVNDIVDKVCVFERSLLARHCACRSAHIYNLAEREGVRCQAGLRNINCVVLKDFLRENVNFTFHLTDSSEVLPFAKQMKMQVGGLVALQELLSAEKINLEKVEDIHQLVIELESQYPDLSKLPMVDILKEISSFKVRKRSK